MKQKVVIGEQKRQMLDREKVISETSFDIKGKDKTIKNLLARIERLERLLGIE